MDLSGTDRMPTAGGYVRHCAVNRTRSPPITNLCVGGPAGVSQPPPKGTGVRWSLHETCPCSAPRPFPAGPRRPFIKWWTCAPRWVHHPGCQGHLFPCAYFRRESNPHRQRPQRCASAIGPRKLAPVRHPARPAVASATGIRTEVLCRRTTPVSRCPSIGEVQQGGDKSGAVARSPGDSEGQSHTGTEHPAGFEPASPRWERGVLGR